MKIIEVDDQLYQYIASKTENIGEQASDILRRLLGFEPLENNQQPAPKTDEVIEVVIPADQQQAQQADAAPEVESQEEVKTTTLKKQEAINEKINADVQSSPVAEEVESEACEVKAEEVADKPVVKPSERTAKAKPVKSKVRKPRIVKGLSQEQLDAQVNGLALPALAEQTNVVKRFLYILSCLHDTHQDEFNKILEVQGRDRLYFATSEADLRGSGSSTNPKQIGSTGYWVLTNSNTDRKRWMLAEVAKLLGYSAADVENLKLKL